jgi:hypothetical protein
MDDLHRSINFNIMRNLTSIGLILLLSVQLNAQNGSRQNSFPVSTPVDQVSLGIGGGLDYGGFGGNLIYYPAQSVGLFGGVGYALAGAGFNAGVKYRYIPDKPDARVRPFGLVMYGYNAAIAVLNASQHNKLFYGPTAGAGIDFHRNTYKRGYWSFAVFVPIRKSEVKAYMEDLENNYDVDFQNRLFPVTVSIGYRFIIL